MESERSRQESAIKRRGRMILKKEEEREERKRGGDCRLMFEKRNDSLKNKQIKTDHNNNQ